VIRSGALLLALAVAHPALAQTAPPGSAPKPSPAKPQAKKPDPSKPDAAVQNGPCIGVIPHIGDRFAVKKVGVTIFGNELKDVPIEPWGLDDLVVARVRAAINARYAVRRIAYPANAFEPFDNPPSLFSNAEDTLKGVVQTIAHGTGCEDYVVVVKAVSRVGDTNQVVRGIGIVNTGIYTFLYTLTYLFVFDGHTFEVLAKGASAVDKDPLDALKRADPIRGPNRELEELRWPTDPDAVFTWPPAQNVLMGLRDKTRALLTQSLDHVLPDVLSRASTP
jgi:hypothetical protein